jgi:hypothetical protein
MEVNARLGRSLQDLHRDYPEFGPAPAVGELEAPLMRTRQKQANLSQAISLSTAREANALAALNTAM